VLSFFSRSLLALKQTKVFFNEQKRRRTKTTHEEDKVQNKNRTKKPPKKQKNRWFLGSSLFSLLFSSFSLFV